MVLIEFWVWAVATQCTKKAVQILVDTMHNCRCRLWSITMIIFAIVFIIVFIIGILVVDFGHHSHHCSYPKFNISFLSSRGCSVNGKLTGRSTSRPTSTSRRPPAIGTPLVQVGPGAGRRRELPDGAAAGGVEAVQEGVRRPQHAERDEHRERHRRGRQPEARHPPP